MALACVLFALAWAALCEPTSAAVQLRPSIGKPVVTPFAFVAAPSGPSALAPTAHGGATVHFGAVEVASVAFTVQRPLPGRVRGKRCVKPTAGSAKAKRCKRYKSVGRFRYVHSVPLGILSFRFTGRVAGRKLKPGPYRLLAVPRSISRTNGAPAFGAFRIV
jgi:hypothetical protein